MEQGLIEYVQGPIHDIAMLQWYGAICANGDIRNLMPLDVVTPSQFYAYIDPKKLSVLFKVDELGVWFVAVYTPMMSGAQFDMWVRADRRHGKGWVASMCEALDWGFERWPVLLGLTAQDNLLDSHRRMGYTVVGKVPKFWDGKRDLWIMWITKQAFDTRETYLRRAVVNG